MQVPNLFKSLSKYGSREAEDYLTESFVILVKKLVEQHPAIGLRFLNSVCGLAGASRFDNHDLISLSTQVVVGGGRLDIQAKSGTETLVYIEVKHDAPLSVGQLEYYKSHLDKTAAAHKAIVLLTRSQASGRETTLSRSDYHHVCWYDVHRELSAIQCDGVCGVCDYLISEFLSFLEDKQMSLQRVGWEYINGVPSMVALVNMLEVAVLEAAPDMNIKKTGGFTWLGFRLDSFYCGIRFAEPLTVVFENNMGTDPTYKRDLDLESQHFFALSQPEQLECLVTFIEDAIENRPVDA